MKEKIAHIGMAVKDVHQAASNLANLLGIEDISVTEYKTETLHYKVGLLHVGELELELIQPLVPTGMAEEHLKNFGPGVYHFAFAVPDLAEALESYQKRGFEHQEIRKGIQGNRVCFLKDEVLPGIYLELVEVKND